MEPASDGETSTISRATCKRRSHADEPEGAGPDGPQDSADTDCRGVERGRSLIALNAGARSTSYVSCASSFPLIPIAAGAFVAWLAIDVSRALIRDECYSWRIAHHDFP